MSDATLIEYTVNFTNGISICVLADSLEEAEQQAHELIQGNQIIAVVVPNTPD
jgi:hypothetical protein